MIDFKKPISCHLFPIRIKEYRDFDFSMKNYEEIKIQCQTFHCDLKNLNVEVNLEINNFYMFF